MHLTNLMRSFYSRLVRLEVPLILRTSCLLWVSIPDWFD